MASGRLSFIVQYVRNVTNAAKFYQEGLGLKAEALTEDFAELLLSNDANATPRLILKRNTESESVLSIGYSPILTFEVSDFDSTVPLLISLGASLDGSISYQPFSKVCFLFFSFQIYFSILFSFY